MSEEKNELVTGDQLLAMRERIKEAIAKQMNRGLHLMDAAAAAGISREMVLANIGTDPDFRRWWEESKSRTMLRPMSEVPPPPPQSIAKKLMMVGLDDKLAVMAALADPSTEAGCEVLLELGKLAAKFMPKMKEAPPPIVDVSAALKELEDIKKERQALLEMQDKATDANSELLE